MAFDKADTVAKVIDIVVQKLAIDKARVQQDSSFEELGADSLDMVEIIMKFEEEFGLEINDNDADSITTVQDAVNALHQARTK